MPSLKNTDKRASKEEVENFSIELKKIVPKLPKLYAEKAVAIATKEKKSLCKTLIYNVKRGGCVNWDVLNILKKVITEYPQELETQEA